MGERLNSTVFVRLDWESVARWSRRPVGRRDAAGAAAGLRITRLGPSGLIDPARLPQRPHGLSIGRAPAAGRATAVGWDVCLMPLAPASARAILRADPDLRRSIAGRSIVGTPIVAAFRPEIGSCIVLDAHGAPQAEVVSEMVSQAADELVEASVRQIIVRAAQARRAPVRFASISSRQGAGPTGPAGTSTGGWRLARGLRRSLRDLQALGARLWSL